ncbi:MAG: hypothetical protein IH950_12110 [Bacteroidetes bacterium]|nr:hypothetical protein [Bacteroidota bacterium]
MSIKKTLIERRILVLRTMSSALITILSGVVMFYFILDVIIDRGTKSSIKQDYFSYLETGLEKGIFNEEYLKVGFNHFDRNDNGKLSQYGYVESLEDFLVYYNSKDTAKIYYEIIIDLLNKAKSTEPFASLPSEERRLMDNVQVFVQKKDSTNALNALNELKQVILARHKEYVKIDAQNAWSVPLAFVGIGFTLIYWHLQFKCSL